MTQPQQATRCLRPILLAAVLVSLLGNCTQAAEHNITVTVLWQPRNSAGPTDCANSDTDLFVPTWGGQDFTIGDGAQRVIAKGSLGALAVDMPVGGAHGCTLSGTATVPDQNIYTVAIDGVGIRQDRDTVETDGWTITIPVTKPGKASE